MSISAATWYFHWRWNSAQSSYRSSSRPATRRANCRQNGQPTRSSQTSQHRGALSALGAVGFADRVSKKRASPLAGFLRASAASLKGVVPRSLAVVRFSRIALRSICRTLLPGVGVLITLPALGIEGAAAGILPPTTFCSRFVDRTADCKAETASLALTSLQRRAQVRQRRSKARVSVEHVAT